MNRFFFIIIYFLSLFDISKQSHIRQGITTLKTISKTIKSPVFKRIGNSIKKPIIKTFGNTIKNTIGVLNRNKNTVTNLASSFQNKYLGIRHNFRNKSVKCLGEEAIKKFKQMAPQAAKGGNRLAQTQGKKSAQIRSAAQMKGQELGSLINMVSKSKPQLPFLFFAGGLNKITKFSLISEDETPKAPPHNPKFMDQYKPCSSQGPPKRELNLDLSKKMKSMTLDERKQYKMDREKHLEESSKIKDYETVGDKNYPNEMTEAEEAEWEKNKSSHKKSQFYEEEVKEGKFEYSSGLVYEGKLVDSMMQGKGKLSLNGDIYEGHFQDSLYHGEGHLSFANLDYYKGNYKKHMRFGYGEYHWLNGDYYKGNWKADRYHGHGEQYDKATDTKQTCEWDDGCPIVNGKRIDDGRPTDEEISINTGKPIPDEYHYEDDDYSTIPADAEKLETIDESDIIKEK